MMLGDDETHHRLMPARLICSNAAVAGRLLSLHHDGADEIERVADDGRR